MPDTSPPGSRASPRAPGSQRSLTTPRSQRDGKKKGKKSGGSPKDAAKGEMSVEAAGLLAEALHGDSTTRRDAEEDELEQEAEAARRAGSAADAEILYRQLLQSRRARYGDADEATICAMDNLGAVLYSLKRDVDGALELLLEALAARRQSLGSSNADTVASMANSGMMLREKGRLDEAEALLREAATAMAGFRDGGDADPKLYRELLMCRASLGSVLKEKGALDEAEAVLREAVDGLRSAVGEQAPPTLKAAVELALVLSARGELVEAEATLREVLHNSREAYGDHHPQVLACISHLGSLCQTKGDIETALMLHQQVLAGFAAIDHPMTDRSVGHVISLLREQGRPDEAAVIAAQYGAKPTDAVGAAAVPA